MSEKRIDWLALADTLQGEPISTGDVCRLGYEVQRVADALELIAPNPSHSTHSFVVPSTPDVGNYDQSLAMAHDRADKEKARADRYEKAIWWALDHIPITKRAELRELSGLIDAGLEDD